MASGNVATVCLCLYGWNQTKNAGNFAKHKVAFEAADRFDRATALVVADLRNSQTESRLNAFGLIGDRLHHVTFTIRRTTVWVISLRKAHNKETAYYEANHQAEHAIGRC